MPAKEWTLMFYFASDNPLASTIVSQLKALKDAGYHPDANVIAQFDPHVVNTPVHVFDVNSVNKFWKPNESEVGFAKNNPFVRDLVLDRLWDEKNKEIRKRVIEHVTSDPEYNKGGVFDPPQPSPTMSGEQAPKQALASFLNFCREFYPARHYMLFILGHGQVVGNDSLLFDDHAAQQSLLLTEFSEVLRTFNADVQNDREPGQVELIGLHSCSMSALEVAYELKGAARYMLASQGPAYVGSWPYKQILIRIFNDLNSKFAPNDINDTHEVKGERDGKKSLVQKLYKAEEPVSAYLRRRLEPETTEVLDAYTPGAEPPPKLVSRIVNDLNNLLDGTQTHDDFLRLNLQNGTHSNGVPLVQTNRRRLNRALLSAAFPEIAHCFDKMLGKIFYYCVYNSYDFQLAGYPYDLCLTNLTKVSDTEDPINNLAKSLIDGLNDKSPIPKQLILLAHWDAQSFYQEDYVDLYDFCFRLKRRYAEMEPYLQPLPALQAILDACDEVLEVLKKGEGKLISRSAFSGAAFQYSNGMSIYFPWTRPVADKMWDEHYPEYRLNKRTKWREFLEVYFEKTRRETRFKERQAAGEPETQGTNDGISAHILSLMGQIGARVFDGEGQLQKPGPDHPMGRYGPDDPTGASCDCPTIKNYPLYTEPLVSTDGDNPKTLPVSPDFLAGKPLTDDLEDVL